MQNSKRITLITGQPGSGKTTVIMKVAGALKTQGYRIGGMTSKEKREGEARVGFEIQDLATQKEGWLAHVNQPSGPKISRYRVNLNDLDSIGAKAITDAVETADVIVIDEIGPMELCSQTFRQAVLQVMGSGKPVVATIHYRATDTFVRNIKAHSDVELIEVTPDNRNTVHNLIIQKMTKHSQGT